MQNPWVNRTILFWKASIIASTFWCFRSCCAISPAFFFLMAFQGTQTAWCIFLGSSMAQLQGATEAHWCHPAVFATYPWFNQLPWSWSSQLRWCCLKSICGTSMPFVFKAWRYKGFCQGGLVWIIPTRVYSKSSGFEFSHAHFFGNPCYPAKSYPQQQKGQHWCMIRFMNHLSLGVAFLDGVARISLTFDVFRNP